MCNIGKSPTNAHHDEMCSCEPEGIKYFLSGEPESFHNPQSLGFIDRKSLDSEKKAKIMKAPISTLWLSIEILWLREYVDEYQYIR